MSEKLLVTLQNGIKRIAFNNPSRRNAVDSETIKAFDQAIEQSAGDETLVVILTGVGESFCAGAELHSIGSSELEKRNVTAMIREDVNPGIRGMRELPKPIIARVHGHAGGLGCNYALAADLIIASDQAFFGELFVRIGLMSDGGGSYFLPRLIGYHRAFEMMAIGDPIPAQQAFEMGIINRVVPHAELDATVDALAARLAAGPGLALAKIKAGLNFGLQTDLAGALEFEAVNQNDCFRSADFKEGVTAFLQKRKAVFTGK
ncbi:MAG: enoyl-CoA hydratase [Blastocatellia bacterium]|nr:enoyl-CoA hydratase [Blastocatellia bacterium]